MTEPRPISNTPHPIMDSPLPFEALSAQFTFKTNVILPDHFMLFPDHSFTFLVGPARIRNPLPVSSEGKVTIDHGQVVLPRGEDHPLIQFKGLEYEAGLFSPIAVSGEGIPLTIKGLSLYIDSDGENIELEQEVFGMPFFDQGLKSRLEWYLGNFDKIPKKIPISVILSKLKEIMAHPPAQDPGMQLRQDVPIHKIAAGGVTEGTITVDDRMPLLLPDGTRILSNGPAQIFFHNELANPLASQDLGLSPIKKMASPVDFEKHIFPLYSLIEFSDPDGTKRTYPVDGNWIATEAKGLGLTDRDFYDLVLTHLYTNGRLTKGAEILAPRPLDPWDLDEDGDAMRERYSAKKKPLPEIRLRPAGKPADYLNEMGNGLAQFKDQFIDFGKSLIKSATTMVSNFDIASIINPDGMEAQISIKGENLSFVGETSSQVQDWLGVRTMGDLLATKPLRLLSHQYTSSGKLALTGDVNIPKGFKLGGFELPELALKRTGPTEMDLGNMSFGYDAQTREIHTGGQSRAVYDVSDVHFMGLHVDARLQGAMTMTGLNPENSDYAWGFKTEGEQQVTLNMPLPVQIFPTEVPVSQTRVTVKKIDFAVGKKRDGTEKIAGKATVKVEGLTPPMNTSVDIELWE